MKKKVGASKLAAYVQILAGILKIENKILKDKFIKSFCYNDEGMPRVWGPKVDVGAIQKSAKRESVKALSLLAISQIEREYDDLSDVREALDTLAGISESESELSSVFASDSWPGAEDEDVILDPIECRSVWRQMESEISYTISQAVTAHEAAKQASNRGPPLWTILAMLVLGWNELVSLLYNPILLILLIIVFIFGRAIVQRINLAEEMEKGFIPALISIGMKLTPIVIEVSQQFAWQIMAAIEKNSDKGQESRQREMAATQVKGEKAD